MRLVASRCARPCRWLAATRRSLALRLALWGGERPLVAGAGELALWLGGLARATARFERGLLRELRGYLRAGGRPAEARGARDRACCCGSRRRSISGFTIRRYLEPFDEGLLLQAATRMADGQWPYRDFGWPYGPGQPTVVAPGSRLFGPSVMWWRLLRVAADATAALLVWALVRREAGPRWARPAWLAAAVTVAQPTSANPSPVGARARARRRSPLAPAPLAAECGGADARPGG